MSYRADWKNITKYCAFVAAGAAAVGFIGHEFRDDIVDLVGIKSQFMGMEKIIASDLIGYASIPVGALAGGLIAYIANRRKK